MSTSNKSNHSNRSFEINLTTENFGAEPRLSEWVGMRLDAALGLMEQIHSRSRAKALLDAGSVTVNGKTAKASHRCELGDSICVRIPEAPPSEITPFAFKLDVMFEDEDLLVVNKPACLVVHPGAGHHGDTLVNALIAHTRDLSMAFGEDRPGIVHRIDKETSGLLVVAKNDVSHLRLAEQFRLRQSHRLYEAICVGSPMHKQGKIQSYLARHPNYRQRFASVRDQAKKVITDVQAEPGIGKWAVTHYKVLKVASGMAKIELKLETGRTHQIRVHLSEVGLPIIGDNLYQWDRKKSLLRSEIAQEISELPRFFLHAKELGFRHPRTEEDHHFTVNWPAEDLARIESWGLG